MTLQLEWVTQAQFAGDEEGLEVTIKPGGPDIAPAQALAGGGADVIFDWMRSPRARRGCRLSTSRSRSSRRA